MPRPAHLNERWKPTEIGRWLYDEKLGGPCDTLAMSAIAGAAASSAAPLASHVPELAALGLSMAGGGWLASRAMEKWRKHFVLKSSVNVRSSAPPIKPGEKPGLCFGYSTHNGEPVYVPDEDLFRHAWIVGKSGVGKTVAGSLLMNQQIERGGGVLFVDGKLDADNIRTLYQYAALCGRAHEFYVLNPGNPEESHTYNPIQDGDPDEISARCLSLIPGAATASAGEDYYKQSANEALVVIIGACQRAGLHYNFYDLAVLMNNARAIEELQNKVNTRAPTSDEAKNLALLLDRYRVPANDKRNPLAGQIDVKRLKETLGGMAGRLFTFGTGSFGQILNDYNPEVRMYDIIKNGSICYVALPTMGKDIAAQNFGKMVVGDYRTAVSWLQRNKADRPKIPFLSFFDEASSYVTESWAVLFEQTRSAGCFLMPAIQVESGFSAISEDFSERVIGNTTTRLYFQIGTMSTAEIASEMIGNTKRIARSTTASGGETDSAQAIQFSPQKMTGSSDAAGVSLREEEQPLIAPDELMSLDRGLCVMQYEGSRVYELRIPKVDPTPEVVAAIGELKLHHPRRFPRPGLDLKARLDDFIQTDAPRKEKSKGAEEISEMNF